MGLQLHNAKYHHGKLFVLKYVLRNHVSRKKEEISKEPIFQGIKIHMLCHFVEVFQRFGINRRSWDTEISELFHKIVVKAAYEATSKNEKSNLYEMALYDARLKRAEDLRKVATDTYLNKFDEGSDNEDDDSFHYNNNLGKQEIIYTKDAFQLLANTKVAAYMHPLLTFKVIKGLMITFCKDNWHDNPWCSKIQSVIKNPQNGKFFLYKALKYSGKNPFYVRTNPSYASDPKNVTCEHFPVFSSVQIKYINIEENTFAVYAKVMCILGVEVQKKTKYFLIVLPYKKLDKIKSSVSLCYEQVEFDYNQHGKPRFDLVEIESVNGEVFVCVNVNTRSNFRSPETTVKEFMSTSFYAISSSRAEGNEHLSYAMMTENSSQVFLAENKMTEFRNTMVGRRVYCNFKGTNVWYLGDIFTENDGNSFCVHYDDGDREDEVCLNNIRFEGQRVLVTRTQNSFKSTGVITKCITERPNELGGFENIMFTVSVSGSISDDYDTFDITSVIGKSVFVKDSSCVNKWSQCIITDSDFDNFFYVRSVANSVEKISISSGRILYTDLVVYYKKNHFLISSIDYIGDRISRVYGKQMSAAVNPILLVMEKIEFA